ncbi:MAG: hypothetical protein RIS17_1321, partial [Pseudomonadota bacterium]
TMRPAKRAGGTFGAMGPGFRRGDVRLPDGQAYFPSRVT